LDAVFLESFGMTAIAGNCVAEGVVVAADGRTRVPESPELTDEIRLRGNLENERKIFLIKDQDKILVYAGVGYLSAADDGFSLLDEIKKQQLLLCQRRFETCRDYVQHLSLKLKAALRDALKKKTFCVPEDDPLIARLLFAGFFRKEMSWIAAQFKHDQGRVKLEVDRYPITPGNMVVLGPPKMWDLFRANDARFAEYIKPLGPNSMLEEGRDCAKGFIDMCKSPLAAEIEPLCRNVGGHVHVAAVTPDGFRWLIEPENTSDED
jgi:hypothetical protein